MTSQGRTSQPVYALLDDWVVREAIPFSENAPETFNAAVDTVIASLGDAVELLGFSALTGTSRFLPTHKGQGLPAAEIAALPTRSGSMKNLSYTTLSPRNFTDFDWLAVVNATAYNRGGAPLQQGGVSSER